MLLKKVDIELKKMKKMSNTKKDSSYYHLALAQMLYINEQVLEERLEDSAALLLFKEAQWYARQAGRYSV